MHCFQECIWNYHRNIMHIFYSVLHLLETVTFNSHFHAYEVITTTHYHACTHHPSWIYESYSSELNGTWFIPLKYHVISNTS